MLKNGRPYNLPQISAPYSLVLEKLDEEGIKYKIIKISPNDNDNIIPSQNFVFSSDVESCEIDDSNPIWLAKDNDDDINICDGHHRYVKALSDNVSLIGILIEMNSNDACRLLNKIQDIYEYEQSLNLEEVEDQEIINTYGDDENQFLDSLEEDNISVQSEIPSINQQTIIAYRKENLNGNSVVGNFFTLTPIKGYNKYSIEFDNLLDTNALGVMFKDSQQPVEILAKIWFPHVNFEELSKKYNTASINLKNKSIAKKAQKMGFDGIKYGDSIIQGLK